MSENEMIDFKKEAQNSLQKSIQKNDVALNLNSYLRNENVMRRLAQLVGDNAEKWVSTILTVGTSSKQLRECDPKTIVHAAIQSISLKLDIDKNLGFAHIVPYGKVAQFQMGYKGFIQLAMRSGQYQTINATKVLEGQLKKNNLLTGEIEFDAGSKTSDNVIGYVAFFRLLNGFEKCFYMEVKDIELHAKKYSKSFASTEGQWKKNFDAMALKTVLKLLLSKYGILSIEMQSAITKDQSVIKDLDGAEIDYVDVEEIKDEVSGA